MKIGVGGLARAVAMLLLLGAGDVGPAAARKLQLGVVSDNVSEEIERALPFIRLLAKSVAAEGFTAGGVVVAQSVETIADKMRQGEVDLVIDSPLVALNVAEKAGGQILARRWKRGRAEYRSVIFVRSEAPIATLADLRGKTIAFEDRQSTTAYILPRLLLAQAGVELIELKSNSEVPPPDKLGFVFSTRDENTVAWVARQLVDAGAGSDENIESLTPANRAEFKTVIRSVPIPRNIVIHRRDLAPSTIAKLRQALFDMHNSEDGRKVMAIYGRTTRFDAIPPEGIAAIGELAAAVRRLPLPR